MTKPTSIRFSDSVSTELQKKSESEGASVSEVANRLLSEKLFSETQPADLPKQEEKVIRTTFEYNQNGDPLCIHDNKVIEMTFIDGESDIHLGKETAQCKYKRLNKNFDPLHNSDDLKVCLHMCKLAKQNDDIRKLALDRAKVNFRTNAKFNYEVDMMKEKQKALPPPKKTSTRTSTVDYSPSVSQVVWRGNSQRNWWDK